WSDSEPLHHATTCRSTSTCLWTSAATVLRVNGSAYPTSGSTKRSNPKYVVWSASGLSGSDLRGFTSVVNRPQGEWNRSPFFDDLELACVFMMKRILFVVSSILFSGLLSMPKVFGQSCRLDIGSDGDSEVWFEGTVDDSHVRVYWNAELDGKLTGSFYDLGNWSPVFLDGARRANFEFSIADRLATAAASPSLLFWE